MFVEIFFLSWNQRLSEDAIDANLRWLIKLPTHIKGITDVYAGKNYSRRFSEYTHAVIAYAKDETALGDLRTHLVFMREQHTIVLQENSAQLQLNPT